MNEEKVNTDRVGHELMQQAAIYAPEFHSSNRRRYYIKPAIADSDFCIKPAIADSDYCIKPAK